MWVVVEDIAWLLMCFFGGIWKRRKGVGKDVDDRPLPCFHYFLPAFEWVRIHGLKC